MGEDFGNVSRGSSIHMIQESMLNVLLPDDAPRYATEHWRSVDAFEHYEVSSNGRFRDSRGRMLTGSKNHNGYIHIGFTKNGKQHIFLAHRIVAQAFVPKPQTAQYLIVNHKDRNKHNNCADNLEWATVAANTLHWRRVRTPGGY